MEPLARALHVLVPVLWTAAAAAYLSVFVRDDEGAGRWAPRLAVVATLVHLAELAATWAHGIPPLVQPGALISGIGLAVVVVYLLLERKVGRRTIGIFAVGTAALLATAGAGVGDPLHAARPDLPPARTSLHVSAAILGYAGLLLAAVFGSLLLAQRRALREHRFGLFWERLPSLELLDQFTTGSLVAATCFLTVAIGLGHFTNRAVDRMESYWSEPKVVATNALWLLCLAAAAARKLHRLRPHATAVVSIALFLLALGNMMVVDRFSKVHAGL